MSPPKHTASQLSGGEYEVWALIIPNGTSSNSINNNLMLKGLKG